MVDGAERRRGLGARGAEVHRPVNGGLTLIDVLSGNSSTHWI